MFSKKNNKIRILSFVLMIGILSGCSGVDIKTENQVEKNEIVKDEISYERSEFVLGTIVSVKIFEDGSEAILNEIYEKLTEIEDRMSFNSTSSEVLDINAKAGETFVIVSEDTFEVVKSAVDFAEKSEGRFDPTIGPLVQLWGIGSEGAAVPLKPELHEALDLIDWKLIEFNGSETSIKLNKRNMEIDLGAIAKGYASDEVVRILKEHSVSRGIINLGGNVFAYGEKVDGSPWRIGVQNPFSSRGAYIGIIEIKNKSVVTSGIYERFFEEEGKRYHHILNPETGYPVEGALASVTIISDNSMAADALSTILFAAGVEEGKKILKTYYPDVDAVFVTHDKQVFTTDMTDYNVNWTDDTFNIQP